MIRLHTRSLRGAAIALALIACEGDTGLSLGVDGPEDVSIDITPILGHFGSEVEISIDGDQVVLRSNGIPNQGPILW